jgi:hypothetical protein
MPTPTHTTHHSLAHTAAVTAHSPSHDQCLIPKYKHQPGPPPCKWKEQVRRVGCGGWCMGIQSGNSVIQEVHVRWWYGILKEVVVKSKPPLRHRTSQVSAQFASTATQWATNGTGVWFDHRPISPTCIGGELDCDQRMYISRSRSIL